MNWFYQLSRVVCFWILALTRGFTIEGKENMPEQGGVIVMSNHCSNWDPVTVGCALRRPVHYLAKEELFSNFLGKILMYLLMAFPIKRGESDRKAIRECINILEQGEMIGIFPEGTRSKDGNLGQFQSGIGLIALKAKVPILPVAILGTAEKGLPIKLLIGEPIELLDERLKASDVARILHDKLNNLIEKARIDYIN